MIGAPIATAGLPGRNPNFSTRRWFLASVTKLTNAFAGLLGFGHPRRVEDDQRVVGEECPSFG